MSPDGDWIAVIKRLFSENPELVLVPTGPGQPKTLDMGGIQIEQRGGVWIMGTSENDLGALLFPGREGTASVRMYHLPRAAGAANPKSARRQKVFDQDGIPGELRPSDHQGIAIGRDFEPVDAAFVEGPRRAGPHRQQPQPAHPSRQCNRRNRQDQAP